MKIVGSRDARKELFCSRIYNRIASLSHCISSHLLSSPLLSSPEQKISEEDWKLGGVIKKNKKKKNLHKHAMLFIPPQIFPPKWQ